MKKAEFLNAIKGLTIKVSYHNDYFDVHDRSARIEIEGLPPALKEMHVNQVAANLKAWCSDYCTTEDHKDKKAWGDEILRLDNLENNGGKVWDTDYEAPNTWYEFCILHPTQVYRYL